MKKLVIILLHLLYWIVYIYVFVLFIMMTAHFQGFKLSNMMFIRVWQTSFFIPGIIAFYSSYTFLFSMFLKKKRILALLLYSFSVFLISALIAELFLFLYITPTPGFAKMGLTSAFGMVVFTFIIALINGIMGFILRGFITWYRDIKVKEELNKKNYEMELALVKNQINPHFLFNTINNIDVMIAKDAGQASAYLNKLSDIMRFMLYETKTEKIPLSKELTYIEKYIDLQKIRTSNINYVNYHVEGDGGNLVIAPMLFIPFIENAFKHAENKKLDNAVNIKLTLSKEMITFECENKFSESASNNDEQSGLGNELIAKRLQLLYPNKHTLDVSNKNQTYHVKLVVLPV
jgi:two-component system LytT family sensor kinase